MRNKFHTHQIFQNFQRLIFNESNRQTSNVKNQDVIAIDILIMDNLANLEYQQYLNDEGFLYIDHHDVLRSSRTGYPVTTTKE